MTLAEGPQPTPARIPVDFFDSSTHCDVAFTFSGPEPPILALKSVLIAQSQYFETREYPGSPPRARANPCESLAVFASDFAEGSADYDMPPVAHCKWSTLCQGDLDELPEFTRQGSAKTRKTSRAAAQKLSASLSWPTPSRAELSAAYRGQSTSRSVSGDEQMADEGGSKLESPALLLKKWHRVQVGGCRCAAALPVLVHSVLTEFEQLGHVPRLPLVALLQRGPLRAVSRGDLRRARPQPEPRHSRQLASALGGRGARSHWPAICLRPSRALPSRGSLPRGRTARHCQEAHPLNSHSDDGALVSCLSSCTSGLIDLFRAGGLRSFLLAQPDVPGHSRRRRHLHPQASRALESLPSVSDEPDTMTNRRTRLPSLPAGCARSSLPTRARSLKELA